MRTVFPSLLHFFEDCCLAGGTSTGLLEVVLAWSWMNAFLFLWLLVFTFWNGTLSCRLLSGWSFWNLGDDILGKSVFIWEISREASDIVSYNESLIVDTTDRYKRRPVQCSCCVREFVALHRGLGTNALTRCVVGSSSWSLHGCVRVGFACLLKRMTYINAHACEFWKPCLCWPKWNYNVLSLIYVNFFFRTLPTMLNGGKV